jgi:hypothetical protein
VIPRLTANLIFPARIRSGARELRPRQRPKRRSKRRPKLRPKLRPKRRPKLRLRRRPKLVYCEVRDCLMDVRNY